MQTVQANEQKFQSVYFDQFNENWKKRIVFHEPLFDQETPGVVALKSLRLENTYGFVVSGPKSILKDFRDWAEKLDAANELGKEIEDLPGVVLSTLLKQADKLRLTVNYVQMGPVGGVPSKEVPVGSDKLVSDAALARANASFVRSKVTAARGGTPTLRRIDQSVRNLILSHNCIWVSHDLEYKAVAAMPLAQTPKFSIYKDSSPAAPVMATAAVTKETPADFRGFLSAVATAKKELQKRGIRARFKLDDAIGDVDGYTLVLTAGLSDAPFELAIDECTTLATVPSQDKHAAVLSYFTGVQGEKATLLRSFFRSLKSS